MSLILEILVSIFLLIGAFFMLVGGIGMVRLPICSCVCMHRPNPVLWASAVS